MSPLLRLRHGHLEYRTGRSWRPSRSLRFCCRIGLHFMAWHMQRDGFYCECGRQHLLAEQIRGVFSPVPAGNRYRR